VGHAIHALVMTSADARTLVGEHAEMRAFALPQGWAIVPVEAERIDALAERLAVAADEVLGVLSKERPFAEIQTDYFGGRGGQRALVWRDGQAIVGSGEWCEGHPINEALRTLGVRAMGSDEFDALELVRFRDHDDFASATPL